MSMPTHPVTGLRAIGFTRRGPVWPVIGASEDHAEGDSGNQDAGSSEEPPKAETGSAEGSFETITSQEQLDKIINQRIGRERAKYANYDQYKADSGELSKIREANKTELQRATDRATEAEKRAEKAEYNALCSDIARTKGVPKSSLTGKTREELEASADQLIAWRDEKKPDDKKKPPPSGGYKSGASGTGGTTQDPKTRAAEALRLMRSGS